MANGQVVTNYARTQISGLIAGKTLFLGVGTGVTTPANADTALTTELTTVALGGSATYARAAMTSNTQATTTVTNDTATQVATYTNPGTAANTVATTEVGIFDALTVGNMYFHAVFAAINLAPGFGLQATCSEVAG